MPECPEYLASVKACLEEGKSVMLVDARQVARVAIDELLTQLGGFVRLRDAGLQKEDLYRLLYMFYRWGKLVGIEIAPDMNWEEFKKALTSKTLADLAELAVNCMAKNSWSLFLSEPVITKSKAKVLATIAQGTAILAVVKSEDQVAEARSLFQVVEVPKDIEPDLKTVIWSQLDRKQVEDPEFLEKRLIFLSGRDPEHLSSLVSRLRALKRITDNDIRKLQAPKGAWYKVDLSALIILVAAAFVGIRALGLGQNSEEKYVLGLFGGAICWALYRLLSRGKMEES